MENKGFTLIEVLAVILILTGLTLIIVPFTNKAVKDAEKNVNKQSIKNVVIASKNWAADHKEKLPKNGNEYSLSVKVLKEKGYIEKNNLSGCIIITNKDNAYYYKYKDEC